MVPQLQRTGLVALAACSVLWSCRTAAPIPLTPATVTPATVTPTEAGAVEPVALRDDGLGYKERRQREALRGLSYDGDRLAVVAEEARALVFAPDAAAARRELARGRELLAGNQRLEAIAAFTRAVLYAPDRGEGYEALGDALLTQRWSRKAELAFRAGVEVAPTSATLRFKLGDALLREGRLDESLVELREAVRLDPSYGLAHARLAVELYYAHDYEAAWHAVHRAEATGGHVPPQLEVLLARHIAEPERR